MLEKVTMSQFFRALLYYIQRAVLISPWRRRLKSRIRRVPLSHPF
jgi:hypothetical protein